MAGSVRQSWVALQAIKSVPYFLGFRNWQRVTLQFRRLYVRSTENDYKKVILKTSFIMGAKRLIEILVEFDCQFLNIFYMNSSIVTF